MSTTKTRPISAEEFDRCVDNGDDVEEWIEWQTATRPNLETQRVNVDFPKWMVEAMDAEAARLSIPRQAVMKMWLDDRLKEQRPEE